MKALAGRSIRSQTEKGGKNATAVWPTPIWTSPQMLWWLLPLPRRASAVRRRVG
jgi:hypothetical protein